MLTIDLSVGSMPSDKELRIGSASVPEQTGGLPGQMFSDLAYGPENLKLICEAFDRAWEAIKPVVDDNPLAHEAARLKLANMILGIASSGKLSQARARHGAARPGNGAGSD